MVHLLLDVLVELADETVGVPKSPNEEETALLPYSAGGFAAGASEEDNLFF